MTMKRRNPPHRSLVIRTDAGPKIGTGHVMRCLALAQIWQEHGGRVTFISHCENEKLSQRILEGGFDLVCVTKRHPDPGDLQQTLEMLAMIKGKRSRTTPWFVLDGLHFDTTYQKAYKDHGNKVLVIDDMAILPYYHADIVLNQNIHAEDLIYPCAPETVLLMGPKYLLLRREFFQYRNCRRSFPEKARKILVTLGGADPDNITVRIIKALNRLGDPDYKVKLVVGPANPHIEGIREELSRSSFVSELLSNVKNVAELMVWADMAICSGGTTVWEFAFLGVPCIVGATTPIEEYLIRGLEKKGLYKTIGWLSDLSIDKLAEEFLNLILDSANRKNLGLLGQCITGANGLEYIYKTMINHYS